METNQENAKPKIVFMGTPDFALSALSALVDAGFPVLCCVTQPDREKGRGKEKQMPPVKRYAMEHGIPVLQPDKVRDRASVSALRALRADVFVVAAFGQILPQEVLDIPPLGCINIHASLLPRWRGAAPIQHAILAGDAETGVTIMRMDAGCDTGAMLLKGSVPVAETDTGGMLFEKLSRLGGELIVEALPRLCAGTLPDIAQDDALATDAPKLTKESGRIDWHGDTVSVLRHIRAFDPWPGSYTMWNGKPLKVLEAGPAADMETETALQPGCVISATKQGIYVKTGDGVCRILRLQMPGKKAMDASAFLNGNTLESGTVFGR